jgi:hypothetical protein
MRLVDCNNSSGRPQTSNGLGVRRYSIAKKPVKAMSSVTRASCCGSIATRVDGRNMDHTMSLTGQNSGSNSWSVCVGASAIEGDELLREVSLPVTAR